MTPISFMTANDVARHTGWQMRGWGHGDRTTNDHFRPLETYGERFEELLVRIRGLGFDTVDVWGAHLSAAWATDEHVAAAGEALARHGLTVTSYASWLGHEPGEIERACEIALALDAPLIGAGASDLDAAIPILRERGVRLGIENHPEKTPAELAAKIERGSDVLGATVDTGWWGTQGYDAARAIEELGDRVLHVHLKDVLAVGEPHETCPWGRGIVPVEECVRTLQRIGYAGAISVEHEPETYDPSEDCREMLALLLAWLG